MYSETYRNPKDESAFNTVSGKKDRKKMKKSEHRVERNLRKNGRLQVE